MDKEEAFTYRTEYYTARKNNEVLPFVPTWMGLEGTMLSEIRQTEKNMGHRISFICGIKNRNQQAHKLMDTDNSMVVTRGEGVWGKNKEGNGD